MSPLAEYSQYRRAESDFVNCSEKDEVSVDENRQ